MNTHDKFLSFKDSKFVLILYLAQAVVEILAMLWFFTKWKLQNICGIDAASLRQKLAADLS
jgi:hypothetical protein